MDKDTLDRLAESTQKYGLYECGEKVYVELSESPPDRCPNCDARMKAVEVTHDV